MKRVFSAGRLFVVAVMFAGASAPNSPKPSDRIPPSAAAIPSSSAPRQSHFPPEPVSIALLGTALLGGAVFARRRIA